jgi:hypothetical protein
VNSSSADEMRGHLRHIVLPHSIHSYQELKNEFFDQKNTENNGNEDEKLKIENLTENKADNNIFISDNEIQNNDIMLSLSAITSSDINKKKLKEFFRTIRSGEKKGDYYDDSEASLSLLSYHCYHYYRHHCKHYYQHYY